MILDKDQPGVADLRQVRRFFTEIVPFERLRPAAIVSGDYQAGHRPALLILDEPTSGLDPLVRLDILGFLRDLAREENVSILLSSHISDDLDQIADSILMLNKGRVVEYGRALFLLDKYGQLRLETIFVHAIGHQHHS